MNADKEYSFRLGLTTFSLVLSQERGYVELRVIPLIGQPRVLAFPLRILSPELLVTQQSARQLYIGLGAAIFSTIVWGLILASLPGEWGAVLFLAWLVAVPLLLYGAWRESKIRWYVFFFADTGPSFSFPEDRANGAKSMEFAQQIQNAIRESRR